MPTYSNPVAAEQNGIQTINNGAWTGSPVTQHDVLIGGAANAITSVSPSTAGLVLTSNGVSADPSFQSPSASGAVTTITGNSGGAESPLSGNFNILGSGSITVAGTANTETISLTGLTAHNVLLGEGTSTVGLVAPSSTAGVPLVSAGATSDPAFGTATVPGGGTGITSTTAYAVVCGGTSSTSPLQVTGPGTATQVLTSNGASALPTFQSVGATGAIVTITGNTGGAEDPDGSGNFNILGTGSISVVGTTNTETVGLTGLTNHAVLAGAGTSTITNIGPSATTGAVLASNGATSDPSFQTLSSLGSVTQVDTQSGNITPTAGVITISGGTTGLTTAGTSSTVSLTGTLGIANGGTDATTFVAYAPVLGGTTSTGPLQSASTGISNSGYVLTSTGATSVPTWQSSPTATITLDANSGSATGNVITVNGGTTGLTTTASGSTLSLTGTLDVANGGTGATTLTGVLSGNGTSAVTASPITQYDVLVGGASNAIVSVSPSTATFVLTSNGTGIAPSFQSLGSAGGITSITGNSGGAEVPSSGNFNIVGSGSITVAGSTNTETVELTGLTNHAVLVGAGTATITNVGPSSTTGSVLASNGASADPSFQTLSSLGATLTFDADTGSATPSAGVITISGGTNTLATSASGSTVTHAFAPQLQGPSILSLGTTVHNTALGVDSFVGTSVSDVTAIGYNALNANTASQCTAVGSGALALNTSGVNTAVGYLAASNILGNSGITAIGWKALNSGNPNFSTAVGYNALGAGGGGQCVAIGSSSNPTGTGPFNVSVGHSSLGSATTAEQCVAVGTDALGSNISGSLNTATGFLALTTLTTATGCTACGAACLQNTNGVNNTAMGYNAGIAVGSGTGNCLFGQGAGSGITTGVNHVAIGVEALNNLPGGTGNIVIGAVAGSGYTGTESYNILMNNSGLAGNSNTCAIGSGTGTGAGQLNFTYIAGIRGITTGQNNAVAVLVDSNNQLGVTSSSIRYKDNVKTIDNSELLQKLRPVSFNYKKFPDDRAEYGLIAEEVLGVFPEMVVLDDEGRPETIQYHKLYGLLIAEIQRLNKRIDALEKNK